ncbi:50S ribosomal protein L33 [Bifidobacterium margollesii]|uniref:Large ribosomal subunit protein bL33 n=1 Tax=Bifidobacterium margollesii TaxID=2020964 RepID=A0A2N5JBT6_9BIFI|nr:50S ribosomal protein L33 [Bifidobacterium margollesii]PLS31673.1 50S ribosomal protein L33 [Bifidobacterium margollesii]
MAGKSSEIRPVITLRSTAGTGFTYTTRKNRRNTPDRLELLKYDPIVKRKVTFRETR